MTRRKDVPNHTEHADKGNAFGLHSLGITSIAQSALWETNTATVCGVIFLHLTKAIGKTGY